jgi:hypothetical protein
MNNSAKQQNVLNIIRLFEQMIPAAAARNRNREVNPIKVIRLNQPTANNNSSKSKKGKHWTFSGLHQVYVKMFEKMGWMVLEAHEENNNHLGCYLNKISRLRKAILTKAKTTSDKDRVEDLHAMHYNLGVLEKYISNL